MSSCFRMEHSRNIIQSHDVTQRHLPFGRGRSGSEPEVLNIPGSRRENLVDPENLKVSSIGCASVFERVGDP